MNEAIDRVPMRATRRAHRGAVLAVGMPSIVDRRSGGTPGAPHRAGPGPGKAA